jgi:hypothetical protein
VGAIRSYSALKALLCIGDRSCPKQNAAKLNQRPVSHAFTVDGFTVKFLCSRIMTLRLLQVTLTPQHKPADVVARHESSGSLEGGARLTITAKMD